MLKSVLKEKVSTYMLFTKFRLSVLVVLSAVSGYLFVGGSDFLELIYLFIGGFLVTAASNGSNQIWEREVDALMKRTKKRPLPRGTLSLKEAYTIVLISLLFGLVILYSINLYSLLLGLLSYVIYVFLYTPMKSRSSWAVFIGAIPGAIPPMLGAIAYTDDFGLIPGILFFVQFTWQFPHFWAIAWVCYDDYKLAGFNLLPSKKGKSKNSAYQMVIWSIALIPFSLLPWVIGVSGLWSMIVATFLGIVFFYYAYKLLLTCDDKDARKLMFASFVYLPIIQFSYVLDRNLHIIESFLQVNKI